MLILTSIARSGLNQHSLARENLSLLFSFFNHTLSNTILHTVARLHTLQFQPNIRLHTSCKTIQFHL